MKEKKIRRSRIDAYYSILSALDRETELAVNIMCRTGLTSNRVRKFLGDLVEAKLVFIEGFSYVEGFRYYSLTAEAREMLNVHKEFLKKFGIKINSWGKLIIKKNSKVIKKRKGDFER